MRARHVGELKTAPAKKEPDPKSLLRVIAGLANECKEHDNEYHHITKKSLLDEAERLLSEHDHRCGRCGAPHSDAAKVRSVQVVIQGNPTVVAFELQACSSCKNFLKGDLLNYFVDILRPGLEVHKVVEGYRSWKTMQDDTHAAWEAKEAERKNHRCGNCGDSGCFNNYCVPG